MGTRGAFDVSLGKQPHPTAGPPADLPVAVTGRCEPSVAGDRRTLSIGGVVLPFPVQQAALSGYSDRPMRVMARRFGAPYTLCEVMLEQFVRSLRDRRRTRHFTFVADEDHPVGAQLMGDDPQGLAVAARKLVECGFDVIDLNFACPAKKKAARRCRGGLLLTQPDTAVEIIERVRDAIPADVPLTVKLRRGYDDSAQSEDRFWRIVEAAFDRGVAAITVHGRTVVQRYEGPSCWEALKRIKQRLPDHVMLGSGDLLDAESCLRMLRDTGVDGVSVARGAIGNPWIFRDLIALLQGRPRPAKPSVEEQADVMREHMALVIATYGVQRAVAEFRKHSVRYAERHPLGSEVVRAFARARTLEDWYAVLGRYYAVSRRWYVVSGSGR
ncbi:MAG: tRNA-dihydrouridine synthase family protein [Planctomycetota bacterium]|nr:MAG: tRNA-dihydrouridine synthase family protein [Planctomycetota bacterium]